MTDIPLQHNAPIPTWFGVGGGADALARPRTEEELFACLEMDPACRVLGDGANLLVHDAGVGTLVLSLEQGDFVVAEFPPDDANKPHLEPVAVRVGAGMNLPKLIVASVRRGLGGLEGLGGIPATVGGALVMNAGGAFGQIGESVRRVYAVSRAGERVTLEREDIAFDYRASGLQNLLITGCELELHRGYPETLRDRLKEVMAYKKHTQPLGERSAGCCYKNPTLAQPVEGLGEAGQRVSAGMVIDHAGCKGLSLGGATVSERHANFFTVATDGRAADVIGLMEEVERRVLDRFGLVLEREVVVWRREGV